MTDDSEPLAVRLFILYFRNGSVLLCRRTDESHVWVYREGHRVEEGIAAAARWEEAVKTGLQVVAERVVSNNASNPCSSPWRVLGCS